MKTKLLLSVILFFGLSSQIIASPIPMEKFDIGVGYNTFTDEWYERLNSRDGFAFFINTPIDIGYIEFAFSTEFFDNTFLEMMILLRGPDHLDGITHSELVGFFIFRPV